MLKDVKFISNNKNWKNYRKITSGYSNDLKYIATDISNNKYLIRINDKSTLPQKLFVKKILDKIENLNFNKQKYYECELFNNNQNCYSLSKWIHGDTLKFLFDNDLIDSTQRYFLGYKCGTILKKIHSIKIDEKDKIPLSKILFKRNKKICECLNTKFKNSSMLSIINFYNDNTNIIEKFEPKYIHNEFHLLNIVLDKTGEIGIINFDKCSIEDPYLDLVKMQIFNSDLYSDFCIGMLHGYFNNKIPNEFWKKYAVLTAYKCISISLWASKNNLIDVFNVNKIINNIIKQYDNFNIDIPHWYYDNVIAPKESQYKYIKEFTITISDDDKNGNNC